MLTGLLIIYCEMHTVIAASSLVRVYIGHRLALKCRSSKAYSYEYRYSYLYGGRVLYRTGTSTVLLRRDEHGAYFKFSATSPSCSP